LPVTSTELRPEYVQVKTVNEAKVVTYLKI